METSISELTERKLRGRIEQLQSRVKELEAENARLKERWEKLRQVLHDDRRSWVEANLFNEADGLRHVLDKMRQLEQAEGDGREKCEHEFRPLFDIGKRCWLCGVIEPIDKLAKDEG